VVGVEPGKSKGKFHQRYSKYELLSDYQGRAGHAMIMVLDFAKLIAQEFSEIAAVAKSASMAGGIYAGTETADEEDTSDELQLVSFDVAGRNTPSHRGCSGDRSSAEKIIHVPHSESYVLV